MISLEMYAALAAPFPPEAVERTFAAQTRKGYDTTGIKYQYVVNRLNEVLGPGRFRAHRTMRVIEGATQSGRAKFDSICELTLELGYWENNVWIVEAQAISDGGHTSASEADARKGAYTNAFKKAAAFFGVGRQAYEGTLDDDNVPAESGTPVSSSRPKTVEDWYNSINECTTRDQLQKVGAAIKNAHEVGKTLTQAERSSLLEPFQRKMAEFKGA